MKLFCVALVAFFILTTRPSVFSQPTAPFGGAKVAVMNSAAFYDEKAGITKLVNAYKLLNDQFKPEQDKLVALNTRIQALAKEIEQLQAKLNEARPAVPIDVNATRNLIITKNEEGERLQIDLKRKQEDAKQAYERESKLKIDPISNDIGKAIDAYAKTRGIDLILDLSKLAETGAILALSSTADVTDAFIKDYNAKNSGVPVK
jgi:Skp family chaperone for outer membrane proteins